MFPSFPDAKENFDVRYGVLGFWATKSKLEMGKLMRWIVSMDSEMLRQEDDALRGLGD
jgi:hypothetical protein